VPGFDLDAYLARIGAAGVRGATLETLRAVHAAHPAAIPFENLNPLMGLPVALDAESLHRKLVMSGRGGWCFEHNTLLRMALEALGVRVTGLAARVLWNMPPGPVPARSHMLLRVEAEGHSYLADVGFGGNTLTGPLCWEPGVAQETPHEPHRLVKLDGSYVLEAQIGEEWKPLFRFTDEAQFPPDYEVSSWYLCTHPASHFRRTLVAARATRECRYALRDTSLSVHTRTGTEKRVLATPPEIKQCLARDIGIRLPEAAELDAALDAICSKQQ
jgi:N-hydroxyarylamine O-acetyltransferase